jgi:hypothetical protein
MFDKFKKLVELAGIVNSKYKVEQQEFMKFYKDLVETVPTDTCKLFGTIYDTCIDENKKEVNLGIMLTVADYLYWVDAFEKGVRFKISFDKLKSKMLIHLAKAIEQTCEIDPQDRKTMLAILIEK